MLLASFVHATGPQVGCEASTGGCVCEWRSATAARPCRSGALLRPSMSTALACSSWHMEWLQVPAARENAAGSDEMCREPHHAGYAS